MAFKVYLSISSSATKFLYVTSIPLSPKHGVPLGGSPTVYTYTHCFSNCKVLPLRFLNHSLCSKPSLNVTSLNVNSCNHVENSTEISQKTEKSNCHMTKHFHFPLKIFLVVPGYISPNPQNTNLKRYIHTNIHSKNCQATEQRKCTSMDDWMKKIWNITQP